jgi:hypothetical protein
VVHQRSGAPIVAQHRDVEAADTGCPGTLGERRQQSGSHAAALPLIDHLDGRLGDVELVQPHVPGDPYRSPGWRRERDQRLVVPVVDAEQMTQVARGQLGLGGEVALVARPRAQPSERERHRATVARHELADRDRRHLIPHR